MKCEAWLTVAPTCCQRKEGRSQAGGACCYNLAHSSHLPSAPPPPPRAQEGVVTALPILFTFPLPPPPSPPPCAQEVERKMEAQAEAKRKAQLAQVQ